MTQVQQAKIDQIKGQSGNFALLAETQESTTHRMEYKGIIGGKEVRFVVSIDPDGRVSRHIY